MFAITPVETTEMSDVNVTTMERCVALKEGIVMVLPL